MELVDPSIGRSRGIETDSWIQASGAPRDLGESESRTQGQLRCFLGVLSPLALLGLVGVGLSFVRYPILGFSQPEGLT